ncbi:MAG: tetratricopeptide repeat protein [Bacteroidia bacterium]
MHIHSGAPATLVMIFVVLLTACRSTQPATGAVDDLPHPAVSTEARTEDINRRFVDACTQMMRGDLRTASRLFEEVLAEDPANHAALYNLARLAIEQREYPNAIRYGGQALQLDPANPWYYIALRQAYELSGDYTQAIQTQEQLLRQFPTNHQARLELSELYMRMNKPTEALAALDQLDRATGISEKSLRYRYEIHARTSNFAAALATAQTLVRMAPGQASYYEMCYDMQQRLGQSDAARQTLEAMLAEFPDNGFALLSLADYYKNSGDIERSDTYLYQAFANPSISDEGKVRIIDQMLPYADDAAVRERIFRLSSLLATVHPASPGLFSIRARLFTLEGRTDSARACLVRSLELEPANISVWMDLLQMDLGAYAYDDLMKDSELALEHYPNQEKFLYYYAVASTQAGKYDRAANALEKVGRLTSQGGPVQYRALALLGYVRHKQGQQDLAQETLDRALALGQSDPEVQYRYASYLLARGERLSEAGSLLQAALQAAPRHAEFLEAYGLYQAAAGDTAQALQILEQAAGFAPTASILEHLGDLLYKTGQRDQAMQRWQQAIDAGATFDLSSKLRTE